MSESPRRPNLLVILDDQHRFDYLGCAGAKWVRTPNLDKLASRGVRFTQCCTNAPVCAPARIALSAGLQPHRLGALGNSAFLPRSAPTYYQHLRDHGYYVGCVGKLDLAKPDGYNGRDGDRPATYMWGFTHPVECEGKMHAGHSPEPRGPYGLWLRERGLYEAFHQDYKRRRKEGYHVSAHDSVLPTEAFEDCYIGRRSAEWIERTPGDFPWHLFVSFVGPHDPYDPPAEYGARYRGAEMPPPIPLHPGEKPAWIRERQQAYAPEKVLETRRQYCAAIEAIDDQVGLILAAVEKRGWTDNTYVIFASDHGEMLGDHGLYTKSVPYEAALRVPLLAAGPGIAGGRVCEAPVELIDINPTVCELAGLPAQPNLDARSFAPVLRGESATHRSECLSGLRNFSLVRTERHKLVRSLNDETELYDLREDPHEQRNLARDQPQLVKDLSALLNRRMLEGTWLR
ncbi:MAG: sulfatase-like hydrolase/transferase [Planctomycetota bacterium]|nr:sulfatase-like hydrolase/transferase [Planctomycetota bacterium]